MPNTISRNFTCISDFGLDKRGGIDLYGIVIVSVKFVYVCENHHVRCF